MIQPTPPETPLEELHRIRREIAERFDENVFAIADDAAKRLAESGRPIWKGGIRSDSEGVTSDAAAPKKSSNSGPDVK